jgi:hypothetical protein
MERPKLIGSNPFKYFGIINYYCGRWLSLPPSIYFKEDGGSCEVSFET